MIPFIWSPGIDWLTNGDRDKKAVAWVVQRRWRGGREVVGSWAGIDWKGPWGKYSWYGIQCLILHDHYTRCLKVKVAQSRPTLCNPMDYTVHGILQAGILEWVAFPFSRGSSQPRDGTQVSLITGGFFTSCATREASWFGGPGLQLGSLCSLLPGTEWCWQHQLAHGWVLPCCGNTMRWRRAGALGASVWSDGYRLLKREVQQYSFLMRQETP